MQKYYLESYSYCGFFCDDLVPYGLGKGVGEYFSDWMAANAFHLFLKRLPNQDSRIEAVKVSRSTFCIEPSPEADAPEIREKEKLHSQEEHPENRHRQLTQFIDETAKLIDCSVDPKNQGFSQCQP